MVQERIEVRAQKPAERRITDRCPTKYAGDLRDEGPRIVEQRIAHKPNLLGPTGRVQRTRPAAPRRRPYPTERPARPVSAQGPTDSSDASTRALSAVASTTLPLSMQSGQRGTAREPPRQGRAKRGPIARPRRPRPLAPQSRPVVVGGPRTSQKDWPHQFGVAIRFGRLRFWLAVSPRSRDRRERGLLFLESWVTQSLCRRSRARSVRPCWP
jgi:hypothetical protein